MINNTKHQKISVITVCRNSESTIEQTIQSVLGQTYEAIEYIIIDGASTDGTMAIIDKYREKLAKVVSEPDAGIYEAMNKGIDLATGDWLFFLGADDALISDNVFSSIFDGFDREDASILYGNVLFDAGGISKSRFSPEIYIRNTVRHQGAFYNKKVFYSFRYDPHYKILSDYELNLKLFKEKVVSVYLDKVISFCRKGVSWQGRWIGYLEEIKIRRKVSKSWLINMLDLVTVFKFLARKFVSLPIKEST